MSLFDKRFTVKYIWSFFLSALMIALLVFVFRGFRGNFQKRSTITLAASCHLMSIDTSDILTVLPPEEIVNVIALDYHNRSLVLIENEDGYRGWMHLRAMDSISSAIANIPVLKTSAMATFTPKSFEKRIIGHPLDAIEKNHGLALDIKPLYGRSFEATFPFRIYDYSVGTITDKIKVIFVDGAATSYRMEPIEIAKWKNNKFFPLVPAMISLGWADKAPQSDILLKYNDWVPFDMGTLFPDTFWGGLLKVVAIIILIFFSIAFFGMIPYLIEKPILDIVRFSPASSRIGGKIFVIVFNFVVYYISLQALYIWIGFSWIALVIAIICMLRVILKNIPLVTCCRYIYLMDAKCEKCNRTRSYEVISKKVISSVPYSEALYGDFFKASPHRRTRKQKSESIFITDVTPKHYRKFKETDPLDKDEVLPGSYVEEYEYTFKCKFCGETATYRTRDRVAQQTPAEPPVAPEPEAPTPAPEPEAPASPDEFPSVLADDNLEE